MRVGLVIVSHSAKLAEGVVELAGQMAPDVSIVAAGGMPDGGLGTDFDRGLRRPGRRPTRARAWCCSTTWAARG